MLDKRYIRAFHDPERQATWTLVERWPVSPRDLVFFVPAIKLVGEALMGVHWIGNEGDAGFSEDWPDDLRLWNMQIYRHRPPFEFIDSLRDVLIEVLGDLESEVPTSELDGIITDRLKYEIYISRNTHLNSLGRLAYAARTLHVHLMEGEITAFMRPVSRRGRTEKVPIDFWHCDDISTIVSRGFEVGPFEASSDDMDQWWIFVSKEHLTNAVSKIAQQRAATRLISQNEAELKHYISPQLAFLAEMARCLALDEADPMPHKIIVHRLQEAWSGAAPLSQTMARSMATILRPPEAAKGRGAKRPPAPGSKT